MKSISMSPTRRLNSEAVVDGLIGGLVGGVGMLVLLILFAFLFGESPITMINRFGVPGQPANPLASTLLHLGVSAVYGAIYGILINLFPPRISKYLPGWIWGAGFGLTLWLLAVTILLPSSGSALLGIPSWQFLIAHLVYGALLGLVYISFHKT
jgi:hypothetical protein